jgi:CRP/FNR family transcriptional regulator, cyclic AMP receptor protein
LDKYVEYKTDNDNHYQLYDFQKGALKMTATEISASLQYFKLFQHLTEEELNTVAELCILKKYQRGDYIFLQSDRCQHVYFQLKGKVKLFSASESGSEQTFMLANQGDLFPHVGFFRTGNYPYHATAIEDTICVAIPIDLFKQLLIRYPSIHFKITQVLADKILELQQRLEDKTFFTIEGQLISLLLRLASAKPCQQKCEEWCLVAPLTNSELAGLLGTTRETVNRVINKIKKNNAITIGDDGRMRICVERLQKMLPSIPKSSAYSEKWPAIRHYSKQCCISGGHEI